MAPSSGFKEMSVMFWDSFVAMDQMWVRLIFKVDQNFIWKIVCMILI